MAEPITAASIFEEYAYSLQDHGLYRWQQRAYTDGKPCPKYGDWTEPLGEPITIAEQHADFRGYRIELIKGDPKHFYLRHKHARNREIAHEVKLVP